MTWETSLQAIYSHSKAMSLALPRRLLIKCAFRLPSSSPSTVYIPHRHESTARRTTKRLRPKQDKAAVSSRLTYETRDHIVFNPPSSAPSPYHTPPKFLPPNDPRRRLLTQSQTHTNPYQDSGRHLPPAIRKPYTKTYHLNDEQIAEIRRLRSSDPFRWTRAKLAEKFGCTEFFVGMVVQAPKERMDQTQRQLEAIKDRWGTKRTLAREDRAKRRAMWGRDE